MSRSSTCVVVSTCDRCGAVDRVEAPSIHVPLPNGWQEWTRRTGYTPKEGVTVVGATVALLACPACAARLEATWSGGA